MPNNLPLKVTDALADLFLRSLPDGATRDEVSDLLDDRRVLLARVAELEGVVERLPKTQDGAPLLLDGTIYYDNRDRALSNTMSRDDFPNMSVTSLALLGNSTTGVGDMREVGLLAGGSSIEIWGMLAKCYSTREAANAAIPKAGGVL